jgi:molybdopterin-guanine dinucleotide biosynthesis protein A
MGGNITMILQDKIAVIIAGGESSRMQKDKALLPFGGFNSLCEFQYHKLNKLFSKVYVSAKTNKFDFEVEMIEDSVEVCSPLVALISIFETLELEHCFVLSVDAPFVDEKVIHQLYRNLSSEDVTVAISNRGLEPLCAIYKRSFLEEAKRALEERQHRLQTLFESLKVNKVYMEDEEAFENLNYPKEYQNAIERYKKKL